MNFRPHRRESPELNLIPLIDVLIVLLIFLVMTTSFNRPTVLGIHLPAVESVQAGAASNKTLVIEISGSGEYRIAGRDPVALGLMSVLAEEIPELARQDATVLVQADASTQHQAVMEVLDVLSKLGVSKVQLAAQRQFSGAH